MAEYRTALIVGAGSGLSASLARLFSQNGMQIALAARSTEKLSGVASEIGIEQVVPAVKHYPGGVVEVLNQLLR